MATGLRTIAAALVATALLAAPAAARPRVDSHLTRQLAAAGPEATLSVIVHARSWQAAERSAHRAGLGVRMVWESIDAVWAAGAPAQLRTAMADDELTFLEADRPLVHMLDTSTTATRAHEAFTNLKTRDGLRLDGAGTSIAIIDTGTDGNHPFFREDTGGSAVVRNLKTICFPSGVHEVCWVDTGPANDSDSPSGSGHGTHVTGIAAGRPVTTLSGVKLHGMAPGAKVVSISGGQVVSMAMSGAATEWILENHEKPCGESVPREDCPPIKVVNHSHGPGGGGEYDPEAAHSKFQHELLKAGIISVWAAGNSGGDGSSVMTNPSGQDPTPGILSVANYVDAESGTRDGEIANSSSRGDEERVETYPDVSAPGTDILSSCRPWLPICYFPGEDGPGTGDVQTFSEISGTSMASPHVTGLVAVLFQAEPHATPGQVERAIVLSAHRFNFGAPYVSDPRGGMTSFDKGHGLIDTVAAVKLLHEIVAAETPQAAAGGQGAPAPGGSTGSSGSAQPAPSSRAPAPRAGTTRSCRSARARLKAAKRATARARRAVKRARGAAARRRAARSLQAKRRAERRARTRVKARC